MDRLLAVRGAAETLPVALVGDGVGRRIEEGSRHRGGELCSLPLHGEAAARLDVALAELPGVDGALVACCTTRTPMVTTSPSSPTIAPAIVVRTVVAVPGVYCNPTGVPMAASSRYPPRPAQAEPPERLISESAPQLSLRYDLVRNRARQAPGADMVRAGEVPGVPARLVPCGRGKARYAALVGALSRHYR